VIPVFLYKWIAVGAVILLLGIAVKVQTVRLDNAKAETAQVQAKFDLFVAKVKQEGEAQIAKNKEIVSQQQRVNNETVKSADARVATIMDRYKRLLNAGTSSGPGSVPSVPDTAKPVDDTARNQRLAEVLRAAELQSAQLIELQDWVKAQDAVK
jgi:hypothetical protein